MAKSTATTDLNRLPTIALRDLVLFPGCTLSFRVGRPPSLAALKALGTPKHVALFPQKDEAQDGPVALEHFEPVGVLAEVVEQHPIPERADFDIKAIGISRIVAARVVSTDPFLVFECHPLDDRESGVVVEEAELQAIEELAALVSADFSGSALLGRMSSVTVNLKTWLARPWSEHVASNLSSLGVDFPSRSEAAKRPTDPRQRIYAVLEDLPTSSHNKARVLAEPQLTKQVALAREFVTAAVAKASWRRELNEQVTQAISTEHRQLFLREVIRTSLDELGEVGLIRQNPIFRGRGFKLRPELAFALMPFDGRFKPVFEEIIKPIASRFGIGCVRADDLYGPSPIIEDIWRSINEARVVVSDVTGRNPNVFYETGLAHGIGKDVIIITQSMDDVPFDLRHIRCVVYSDSVAGFRRLERDLAEMFSALGLTRLPERPS